MSGPKYDKPLVLTAEEIRDGIQEAFEHLLSDVETAPEPTDEAYMRGAADFAESLLKWMTGQIDKEGNDVSDNSTPG